jgi:hypothetical protein
MLWKVLKSQSREELEIVTFILQSFLVAQRRRRNVDGHLASRGSRHHEPWVSRGSTVGDLGDDRSLKVVINNQHGRPSLLRNDERGRIVIHLVGVKCNRDGRVCRRSRLSGKIQIGRASFPKTKPARMSGSLPTPSIGASNCSGAREVFPAGENDHIEVLKQGAGSRVGLKS